MSRLLETSDAGYIAQPASPIADYPLASVQELVWLDQMLHPDAPYYNIGLAIDIEGEVDPAILEEAINRFIAKNDAARLLLTETQGIVRQRVAPAVHIPLHVMDFSKESDGDVYSRRMLDDWYKRPFLLQESALWRMALFCFAPHRYRWLLSYHHLMADGTSLMQSFVDITKEYNRLIGKDASVAATAPSYLDFIVKDHDYLASPRCHLDRAFWQQRLALPPPRIVKDDHVPTSTALTPSKQERCLIPRQTFQRVETLSSQWGISPSTFMLTLIGIYFACLHDVDTVMIGTPIHNRCTAQEKNTFGMFASIVPLSIDVGKADTFMHIARATSTALRRTYRHQRFPISEINRLHRPALHAHKQLFDFLLSFEWVDSNIATLGNATAKATPLEHGYQRLPLAISVRDYHRADDVQFIFDYNTRYFTQGDIVLAHQRLLHMLTAVLADPACPISSIDRLPPDERLLLMDKWNRTSSIYPDRQCWHHGFEDQVARTPEAIALSTPDNILSYELLNAQANRLAHRLIEYGVKPDALVGLSVNRTASSLIGLLAILKAGGAYVPLDPSYPEWRLVQIVDEAQPQVLLLDSACRAALSSIDHTTMLDLDKPAAWANYRDDNPQIDTLHSRCLAYVLFTSGSTGRPKGVMVEHRSVMNLHTALENAIFSRFTSTVPLTVGLNASLSFDASLKCLLGLLAGRRLSIVPQAIRTDGKALRRFIVKENIQVLDCTPSQLEMLLSSGLGTSQPTSLQLLLIGGEAISAPLWTRLTMMPDIVACNCYGPTECTGDATIAFIQADQAEPTMGRPLSNTRLYVLDAQRQAVNIGAIGELYIGGVGVARGYLHRPDLTAERFLPDHFDATADAIMYRSGDFVRYRSDGNLVYLGRNDQQLKIRGFRLEAGDIEARLTSYPGIGESVVCTSTPPNGDLVTLTAYYTLAKQTSGNTPLTPIPPERLQQFLADRLPDYMVPAAYVCLSALPLTPNGKLDRHALPSPDRSAYPHQHYAPPQGNTEVALAVLWQTLLGISPIGRHDNFFALGGHSLLAVKMINLLASHDMSLTITDVFHHPTIASLASHHIKRHKTSDDMAITIREGDDAPPLFFIHDVYDVNSFFPVLAQELDARIPVYGLPAVSLEHPPLKTIEAMAKRLIRMMQAVCPHGPYRMMGWSFGGVLSYEIAIQLRAKGLPVDFVGLLDTHKPRSIGYISAADHLPTMLLDLCESLHVKVQGADDAIATLRAQQGHLSFSQMLARCRAAHLLPDFFFALSDKQIAARIRRVGIHYAASLHYRVPHTKDRIQLFIAEERDMRPIFTTTTTPLLGWDEVLPTAQIEATIIPGNHISLMHTDNIAHLGAAIMRCIDSLADSPTRYD